jgi:hypothetical protein
MEYVFELGLPRQRKNEGRYLDMEIDYVALIERWINYLGGLGAAPHSKSPMLLRAPWPWLQGWVVAAKPFSPLTREKSVNWHACVTVKGTQREQLICE